jgi:AcrR family transcriptional regulator
VAPRGAKEGGFGHRQPTAVTRRRLLGAARQVFLDSGFHGASLEVVAHEAGLTKGAVYSQFQNKADLFLAVATDVNDDRMQAIREATAYARTLAELVEGVKSFWRGRVFEPAFNLAVMEFWLWAARDPDTRARASAEHERLLADVAGTVDAVASREGIDLPFESLDLVRLVSGIGRGLTLEVRLSPDIVDRPLIDWMFEAIQPTGPRGE